MSPDVPDVGYTLKCSHNDGGKQVPNPDEGGAMAPEYKPIVIRNMKQALKWEKDLTFQPLDDTPLRCGEKGIEFDLAKMVNPAIYIDVNSCLDFVRAIKNDHRHCAAAQSIPFHLYWNGDIGTELIMAVRSFLATQDLKQSMLWIWSEDPEPLGNPDWNSIKDAAPFLVEWKEYDLIEQIKGTPLESNPGHVIDAKDDRRWVDSDLFRVLVLHNYGGVYYDADVILLRDFAPLLGKEWLYQWGSSCNFSNGAVACLHKKSELSTRMLTLLAATKPKLPGFDWGRNLYHKIWEEENFDIAPCCLFDLDWLVKTKYEYPQFYVGPFASHEHGSQRRRCVREGEPFDMVNDWFTERMKERLPVPSAVKHYKLKRAGDGSGCEVKPSLPYFKDGVY